MTIHGVLITLAIVSVLAGCAPTEPVASGDNQQQGTAAPTVQQQPSAPATDDPCLEHSYDEEACLAQLGATAEPTASEPTDTGGQDQAADNTGGGPYEPEYDIAIEGADWKAEGIRLRITRLALVDRDRFCGAIDELEAPEACYSDVYEGETIVSLDMRVANESGRDIDFYPDQAVLVLRDEQIDEAMLLGPDQIGGTIRDGVKREGQAWWLSTQPVDAINELGEMRLIIGQPYWTDDFENVTADYEEIDLTVTW